MSSSRPIRILSVYDENQALQKALADEVEAIDFYQSILDNTSSEEVRDIIEHIIQDEKDHRATLEFYLAYSRTPESID